jgi:transcriptional regulator with XRE-family HTH domain
MTQDQEWSESLCRRIGEAIKAARGGQISAQQLAERTTALGFPVSRSRIANLENARKQTPNLAELIVLSEALGITPLKLLFPGAPDELVDVLPGQPVTTLDARARFVGNTDELMTLRDQVRKIQRAMASLTPATPVVTIEPQSKGRK